MNVLTVIATDLLTPLGTYLRLREGARACNFLEARGPLDERDLRGRRVRASLG